MGVHLSDILARLIKMKELDFDLASSDLLDYVNEIDACSKDLIYINTRDLDAATASIRAELVKYKSLIDSIKVKLEATLDANFDSYMLASEQIWRSNSELMDFSEHTKWIKLWPPSPKDLDVFKSIIDSCKDWRRPGLLYGASDSPLITTMFGTEPYYIIDRFPEYYSMYKTKMHPDLIRKMRFYKMDELSMLPNASIGVIVVFNEFPFMPWSMSSELMQILSHKLIAGGSMIFNYNDCSTYDGFKQFEDKLMTYTTTDMFKAWAEQIGLTYVSKYSSTESPFNIMILKKEGLAKFNKKYPSVGFIKSQATLINPDLHKQRIEFIKNLSK